MAQITGTATLNVQPLPNVGAWFVNAESWLNYWRLQEVEFTFDGATTALYVSAAFDATLPPAVFQVDGVDYVCITGAMFASLKNIVDTINVSYQTLRNELKAAGLITQSQ